MTPEEMAAKDAAKDASIITLTKSVTDITGERDALKVKLTEINNESAGRRHDITKLSADLEAARKAIADGSGDPDVLKKNHEAALQAKDDALQGALGKIDVLTGEVRGFTVDSQIIKIANSRNAQNANDVLTLVKANVKYNPETGAAYLAGEGGKQMTNKTTGDPLSFDEHITNLLAEKTYLVKGSGNAGSGSDGNGAGASEGFTRAQIDKMSPEEFKKNEPAIDKALASGNITQ